MTYPDAIDVTDVIETWVEHFDFIEKECLIVPIDQWGEYVALETQARFGWSLEQPGHVCPELIVEQTRTLHPADRKDYLITIMWFCDRIFVFWNEQPGLEMHEYRHLIEAELLDPASPYYGPGNLELLSEVELRALDAGA